MEISGSASSSSETTSRISEAPEIMAVHADTSEGLHADYAHLASEVLTLNRSRELTLRLARANSFASALEEMLDATIELLHADFGKVQLWDGQAHALSVVTHRGLCDELVRHFQLVHADDQSACGRALQQHRRVIVPDFLEEPSYRAHHDLFRSAGVQSVAAFPIFDRNQQLLCMVSAHFRAPHAPSERELRVIDQYLEFSAGILETLRENQRLLETDRRKDEFLATLAHELRNPLAPIRNAVQLMRLRGSQDAPMQRARDLIERQIRHMARLVDDLLEISRITRGSVDLRYEYLDLCSIVVSAAESCRSYIESAGHTFKVEIPAETLYVQGDATRLAQIFSNLLNNAAKYTRSGGRVELIVAPQGDEARVQVKDTGIGIPKHMLGKIFDMFTQVDTSIDRAQGGLGIGLTLVRKLVELHGGRVVADSDGIGTGSIFTVYLPIAQASIAESRIDYETKVEEQVARRKVLVVDDNLDAANSLAAMLSESGHDVRVVYDGADAVRLVEEFQPDIVLLDIGMPRMNGFEAARRIRSLPAGRKLLLAALTGWGQEQDRRNTREAGFDEHLVKPVAAATLMNVLARAPNSSLT